MLKHGATAQEKSPGGQSAGHVRRCEIPSRGEMPLFFSPCRLPVAARVSDGNSSFSFACCVSPLAPLSLSLPAWPHACPAPLLQRGGLGPPDTTLFWETHFSKTHWADGDLITLCCRKSHEKAIIPGYLWPHDRSALQGEKRNGQSTWKGIFFLLLKSGTKGCEDGLSSAEPADTQPSELNGKSYEFTEWELLAKTWGEHGCASASVRN